MSSDRDRILAAYFRHREALRRFLSRRTGSRDTAEDLTQDVWLRLAGGAAVEQPVSNPDAYVFRVAANLAVDRGRAEQRRRLTPLEVDALLALPDDTPGPDAQAQSRAELRLLARALEDMPARRREILLASKLNDLTHREIAAQFGLSTRTVEKEILRALTHCAERLGRTHHRRFGSADPESS
jgi:RNA polymerase sigma-70 factor (ECF subfamily)